jgi:hypothetical protein
MCALLRMRTKTLMVRKRDAPEQAERWRGRGEWCRQRSAVSNHVANLCHRSHSNFYLSACVEGRHHMAGNAARRNQHGVQAQIIAFMFGMRHQP